MAPEVVLQVHARSAGFWCLLNEERKNGRPGWGKRGLHPAGSERREHSPSNSWACEERGVTDTCFVVVRRGLITNHACNARVSAMHAKSMRAAFVVASGEGNSQQDSSRLPSMCLSCADTLDGTCGRCRCFVHAFEPASGSSVAAGTEGGRELSC